MQHGGLRMKQEFAKTIHKKANNPMKLIRKYVVALIFLFSACLLNAQNDNHLYIAVSGEVMGFLKAETVGWGGALSVGRNFNRFGLSVGYEYFTGYPVAPAHPGTIYIPSKKWMGVAITEKYILKQDGNWHFAILLKEFIGWSKGETLQYYPDAETEEITEVRGEYSVSDGFVSPGFEISRCFNHISILLMPMIAIPISNPLQGTAMSLFLGVCYSL